MFFPTFLSGVWAADKYPTKEIQLVVANPPGGTVDLTTRLLTDSLAKNLGVPVVVSNRTGAGGATGTHFFAKSKTDGYTIGALSIKETVILPATIPDLPYKYKDLDPLCKYASDQQIIFCRENAPWKTLEELVADAKRRPGQINWGASVHSVGHFVMEGFLKDARINLKWVPTKDAIQTVTRMVGGMLDTADSVSTQLRGQIKAGTVRALVVADPKRVIYIPQIPTLKEKGFRDPVITLNTGFFLPLGVPEPIRETLVKALEKTINDPTLNKKLEELGADLVYLPGEAYAKEIENTYKQVFEIAKTMEPQK
jgi:tripartite-type tricarboxylate transporter receptor subunit TctC